MNSFLYRPLYICSILWHLVEGEMEEREKTNWKHSYSTNSTQELAAVLTTFYNACTSIDEGWSNLAHDLSALSKHTIFI